LAEIVNVDFGPEGARAASAKGDLVVIVDVLRFSTTVCTAIANGFTIIPCATKARAEEIARETGATVSGKTGVARYSLSPLDYVNPKNTEEVILISPNGAGCAEALADRAVGFIGCFLNARALARVLNSVAAASAKDITLIAAGEVREDQEDDLKTRRFAIEDYLGCGIILSELKMRMTAEAELCMRAFDASNHDYAGLIRASLSGQYLINRGLEFDISHAVQKNIYGTVPVLEQGRFISFNP
jgi:2-phosphosulfolactate phosphatase